MFPDHFIVIQEIFISIFTKNLTPMHVLYQLPLKKASLVLLLFSAMVWQANAQCLSALYGQWPSTFTPTCNGSTQIITNCGFGSEYSRVNVVSGYSYTFSSSVGSDLVTIGNSTGTTAFAWGMGSVTWDATFTGDVRFYTHIDAACSISSGGCRTKRVACTLTPAIPTLSQWGLIILTFLLLQGIWFTAVFKPAAPLKMIPAMWLEGLRYIKNNMVWFLPILVLTALVMSLLYIAGMAQSADIIGAPLSLVILAPSMYWYGKMQSAKTA